MFYKLILKYTLLLSILIASNFLLGQRNKKLNSFSTDSTKFFEDLSFFLSNQRSAEASKFMASLTPIWRDSGVSATIQVKIIETCNLLLKNKYSGFPVFPQYFKLMETFILNEEVYKSKFSEWHETFYAIINKRNQRLTESFLKNSFTILRDSAIFINKRVHWTAKPWRYRFVIKNNLPAIHFESLSHLVCFANNNSSKIYNTSGTFYLSNNQWEGGKGLVSWERVGFKKNQVYATFDKYKINMSLYNYEIKQVKFYNSNYFKNYLIGHLTEKVKTPTRDSTEARYPKFDSYKGRIKINLAKDIYFEGGFSLHGGKIIGVSNEKKLPAKIEIFRKDTLLMELTANEFFIRSTKISSQNCRAKILLGKDSIFHPGLKINVNTVSRIANIFRDNKGIRKTPFFSSYHNMDLEFEQLSWYIDDPIMSMTNLKGSTKEDIRLISKNFFSLTDYKKLMGMSYTHPFYVIKKLRDKLKRDEITLSEYAGVARYSTAQLKNFLLRLSYLGFIDYDYENKKFTVRKKLINWFRASGGNIDYDVLIINSNSVEGTANAKLNLETYDIALKGVRSVHLSDSQSVTIYPEGGNLILKKDRDLYFDGIVKANKLTMFGSEYFFDYEEFKIDMPKVKALVLRSPDFNGKKDKYGNVILRKVQTVIRDIRGDLYIDKHNNKSGRRPHPEYPIFNSYTSSYVYWNRKITLDGIYKKEKFYFKVDPFTLDSLKIDKSALKFAGKFISYNIFPDFRETLSVQPDYSLGFIKPTPEEGYPIYGGKGNYKQYINLSNQGLRGDGTLSYLTSETKSKDFIFYPDSTLTKTEEFNIAGRKQGVEYPDLNSGINKMRWLPYKDIMYQKMTSKPFELYENKSKLYGELSLSPKGLFGVGLFDFIKGELEPLTNIHFKNNEFLSDSADLRIKDSKNASSLSFTTNNVNSHVSFNDQKGWFYSNGSGSIINFPQNKYLCYMQEFIWDLAADKIILSADGEISTDAQGNKRSGAKFIATKKDQDSLTFYSAGAQYDIDNKIIYADSIDYISLADAIVFPDSGSIVIEKDAYIRPLKKAKITANYITKNHNMYDVSLQINSRNRFKGSGKINYINYKKDTQEVFLDEISVDSTNQTYAKTKIHHSEDFKLSPAFDYYGNVTLKATNKLLFFSGQSRLHHDCNNNLTWFTFKSELDPEKLLIPIDSNTKSITKRPLVAGILLGTDSIHLYSRFINRKKVYSHINVLPATGFIKFDTKRKEYQISSKEKLINRDIKGNYMSLKLKNCRLYGEGTVDLGLKLGLINLTQAGVSQYNTTSDDAIFDLIMKVNFPFSQDALTTIRKSIESEITLNSSILDGRTFEKGLREFLGNDDAGDELSQTSIFGKFKKLPKELESTFFLSEVKFKWDKDKRAYVSFGDISVTSILDKQVNKKMKGHIEMVKKRSGDLFKMYLEVSKSKWYFFSYARNILQFYSSNEELNTKISESKARDRKFKTKKGQLQYMLGSKKKKAKFLESK